MVTKAIIVEVIDKYSAKVRIPTIHKIRGATYASNDDELPTASVCSAAGTFPALRVGDVVYVDFEDNLSQEPVIMGWLATDDVVTRSNIQASTLSVDVSCTLPDATSIGTVTSWDINNVKNSKANLQSQIDLLETTDNKLDTRVDALEKLDKVISSGTSGNNWYRIYQSGWIEQGGSGDTSAAITFPKQFKDTSYTINITPLAATTVYVSERTNTNFTVKNTSSSVTTTTSVNWFACGQTDLVQ